MTKLFKKGFVISQILRAEISILLWSVIVFTTDYVFHLFPLQDSIYSYILKGLISLSTGILLGLIVMYHAREIQVCTWTEWLDPVVNLIILLDSLISGCSKYSVWTNWTSTRRKAPVIIKVVETLLVWRHYCWSFFVEELWNQSDMMPYSTLNSIQLQYLNWHCYVSVCLSVWAFN